MPAILKCQRCGIDFEAKRIDAKWCTGCKPAVIRENDRKYDGKRRKQCPDCKGTMTHGAATCHSCESARRKEAYKGWKNPNWKNGYHITKGGYVNIRIKEGNPGKGKGSFYRGQHILVWEEANDKPLPKGWVVHHLNGIKDDNRIENLAGMPRQEHHSHPREALKPYEKRIRDLEELLATAPTS